MPPGHPVAPVADGFARATASDLRTATRKLTRVFSERYLKTLVVDDEPIAGRVQRKELDPAQSGERRLRADP
jgi:hypothetical protein